MSDDKGRIIHQACQVLVRTYQEIGNLRDDFLSLLSQRFPSLSLEKTEYSFGGASLNVRSFHVVCLRVESEASEGPTVCAFLYVIFHDDGNVAPVAEETRPELWAGVLRIENAQNQISASGWFRYLMWKGKARKPFASLELGGRLNDYLWKRDSGGAEPAETWTGKVLGYPLADIEDTGKVKSLLVDRLAPVLQEEMTAS